MLLVRLTVTVLSQAQTTATTLRPRRRAPRMRDRSRFALGKVAFVMKHRQAAIALMLSVSVRHSPVKFQVVHVMFSIRATAKAVQTQLVLAVRQPAQR